MTPTVTGILVQVSLTIIQVAVLIKFVYHWQRKSWQFTNIRKLRETWKLLRNPLDNSDTLLNELRKDILKFDDLCGLKTYNGGNWTHVAFDRQT